MYDCSQPLRTSLSNRCFGVANTTTVGMNSRFPLLISIVFLIANLIGCAGNLTKDVSESGIAPASNSEVDGQLSCDQMLVGLESQDKAASEDMEKTIFANSQRDTRAYNLISSCLIGKLTEVCSEDAMALSDSLVISEGDFDRIGSMGKILAQIKNADAIPILIDCSDRTRAAGGLSLVNSPAVDPLLRFGDDAIPFLLQKYEDADLAKKCRIASIFAIMRSSKASHHLEKLLGSEKNPNVRKCLIRAVRTFSS